MTLSQADEKKLIEGCISGDKKCQETLYDLYADKMYALCLRYNKNNDAAKDVLQMGFIKIFNSLPQYKFKGSFEGWIRRIFINTSIGIFRKEKKHLYHKEFENVSLSIKSETAVQQLQMEDLMKLVQQLPFGYRTVFNMFVLEGYPHKEIAKTLEISESTSKTQLLKAKQLLRKKIGKRI